MSAPSQRPRGRRSSPSTWAIAGSRPRPRATSRRRSARPAGLRPPALATIRTPLLEGEPEAVLGLADEGAGVAERGVLHGVATEDEHRQLGEVVAGEDVQRPALEHLAHRGQPVAVEAGAVADPQHAGHRAALPSPGGPAKAWAMSSQRSASGPRRDEVGVGPVHPLGHQPAEVDGRPGHRLRGVLGSPRPDVAVGSGQVDAELLGRHVQPVGGEGEVAGAYAEVGDVADPRRLLRLDPERLVHVEAVGPRLHEARGRHRGRRHRRAEPRQLLAVRHLGERGGQLLAARPPALQQVGVAGDLEGARVDEAVRVRDGGEHHLVPRGLALRRTGPRGQRRDLVGPRQVGDLGGDVPPGRRGRRVPARVVEVGDERVEPVPLGGEVGEDGAEHIGHVGVPAAVSDGGAERGRTGASWGGLELPVEHVGPVVEDATAPAGVVGDGVGEPEAAHEVEGGLDELAHPGAGLVGAERLDGEPVGLAADAQLERRDRGVQRLVGPRRHPELERGGEDGRAEVVAQHGEDRTRTTPPARQGRDGGRELGAADLGEVLDGGDDEVVLGREVVQLRPAAHAGPLGDERGRRPGEPALDQALDRRLQQPQPHRPGALLLGHPGDGRGRGGHVPIVGRDEQTVKPDFFWSSRAAWQALRPESPSDSGPSVRMCTRRRPAATSPRTTSGWSGPVSQGSLKRIATSRGRRGGSRHESRGEEDVSTDPLR